MTGINFGPGERWALLLRGARRLCMRERIAVVELRQCGLGGVDPRAEHAPLVGAAEILRPERVRLVLQHLPAHQCEGLIH